jgi:NTE family protein
LNVETVLVLQGGGSLGAYECGVYKSLYKNGIEFDILAGSSIGAINTSIITAAHNGGKEVPAVLEDFWLSLSENILHSNSVFPLPGISSDKMRSILFSAYSSFYGIPKAFMPKWFMPNSPDYLLPYKWTFLYDKGPLKKTLMQYIDFKNLKRITVNMDKNNHNKNGNNKGQSRLIITSTDIQKGEPVIFDTAYMDIDVDNIVAGASYPFYGIRWTEKNGRYLWDGSLLSNTPIMEVIKASPQKNKKFYIVDVFPRSQEKIPENMFEVWHRSRDIIFMDKTDQNIEMLKVTEKCINLLKKMHDIINSNDSKIDQKTKEKLQKLDEDYNPIIKKHGAAITDVIRIGRKEEDLHYLLEDADFSKYRIKKLISQGERDAEQVIAMGKQGDNSRDTKV